ncbi:MAG: DoxX family membrane protein [bacterium]
MKKYIAILTSLLLPFLSSAHIAYVAPEGTFEKFGGTDWSYFLQVFHNPLYVSLMIGVAGITIGLAFLLRRTPPVRKFFDITEQILASYHEFIPWIIRLGLGIALIGAGTEHALISPIIPHGEAFGVLEIFLGFFFLVGFALVPAVLTTLGLYIIALFHTSYLIGNLDIFALAIGVLVFHSARPGVDDILRISLLRFIHIKRHWLAPIMRAGVGIAMTYLAIYEKLLNPHVSDVVVRAYGLNHVIPVSPAMWVLAVAIIEILVGLCIFVGFFTRTTACVAIVVLSFSFFFFKESVASHVSLFSILAIVAIEGGGFLSIDSWLAKRKKTELPQPVFGQTD